VKDATAGLSEDAMYASLEVNLPNYANAIVTTSEIVEAVSAGLTPRPALARSAAAPS
jgi:ureidoacrylate peracid hydrolase